MARKSPMPAPGNRRTPIWLRLLRGGFLAAAAFLILFGYQIAKVYTDGLWFNELGQSGVFRTALSAKLLLFFGFGLLFFLICYLNLWLAGRMNADRPRTRPLRMENLETSLQQEQFAETIRRGARWFFLAGTILFAFLVGGNASIQWSRYLLFTHATSFGQADPIFHNDIGFYIFRLPFLEFLQGWLLFTLFVTTAATGFYHFTQGAVDFTGPQPVFQDYVRKHVLALLTFLVLVYAWGVWLGRYSLLYNENGAFYGAGYTDLHARLPAMTFQVVCLLLTAALCATNIWKGKPFRLPLVGIGAYVVVSLLIGGLYPTFLQTYSVTPNQLGKEREYIAHDIAFTQKGYGLDNVQVQDFPGADALTGTQLADNKATIDNIRLWDWPQLGTVYTVRQALRSYYRFTLPENAMVTAGDFNIDVDRYQFGSEYRQVMLGPRELYPSALPSGAQTWQNLKLQYTHGYGAVMSPVNRVAADGLPEYLMSGMPVQATRPELRLDRPQIYFGEQTKDYVFVDTKEREFDYPITTSAAPAAAAGKSGAETRYEGKGGVTMNGFDRFAWSMRLGDTNMLLSSDLTDRSRLLFRRNIRERLETLAPFLNWDNDPYVVADNGRLLWIRDGYTATDRYPYSKPTLAGTGLDGVDQTFNYIRNSVKAVVDAYDGTVTLYLADTKDPIIAAWSRVYPGLFTPLTQMPASLKAHLRYPEDLFRIQRDMYTIYHIPDPDAYYLKEDAWDVPLDPTPPTDAQGNVDTNSPPQKMMPYYVMMRLPGESKEEFLMMSPFTPLSQGGTAQNLAAWMSARCDPDDYGKLLVYRFPKDKNVNGPQQMLALVRKQPEVSQQETLLSQRGSKIIYGNLLIIPIENSLLYVIPVYVQASGSGAVPGIYQVIVATGTQIVMRPTLDQAIAALTAPGVGGTSIPTSGGATTGAPPGNSPSGPQTPTPNVSADPLQRAIDAYNRSRQKQKEYDRSLDELGKALQDLQNRNGGNAPRRP